VLKVDDYRDIRVCHRDGLGIRAIARKLHHSRRVIRAAIQCAEPTPYTRTKAVPRPKLGAFTATIEQILKEDEQAPRKQRHTAMQVFRRLVEEHQYRGGYDAVRRYIGTLRRRSTPTFIPLQHPPGRRLEADFGHIHVDYADSSGGGAFESAGGGASGGPGWTRRQVPVLILTWSYSHALFMMKLPTERLESVLLGLVTGLEFFGCVPRELWWDNPKALTTAIMKGRERRVNERYAALASHYRFDPKFCMPASGWEKPDVERRVYDLQRRFATPVPRVKDDDELNAYLRECCVAEMQRTVSGRPQTIGQMFEEEKTALLESVKPKRTGTTPELPSAELPGAGLPGAGALPVHRFDPCIFASGKVDHYQTVRYDKSRYSVPRHCPTLAFGGGGGGGMVTIKAYADRVEIVAAGQVVARHPRRYDAGLQLDPLHYLVTLGRRPMALDHADLYRQWQLPAAFNELRRKLEARHGAAAGIRHYIQVLQLLAEHPLPRVRQAVETALGSASSGPPAAATPNVAAAADASQAQAPCVAGQSALLDATMIRQLVQQLAIHESATDSPAAAGPADLPAHLIPVTVPAPDLNRFNVLLASASEVSEPASSSDPTPSIPGDIVHA